MKTSGAPQDLLTPATSLRPAFRFRWEFLKVLDEPRLQGKGLSNMKGLIEGMNADAHRDGLLEKGRPMSLLAGMTNGLGERCSSICRSRGWSMVRHVKDYNSRGTKAVIEIVPGSFPVLHPASC